MNFSLRTLLLVMVVLAVGVSAYVFQLQWATSLLYTFCMTVLLLAAVAAVFARGEQRLFWAGFAVLGWGYWALAFDAAPQAAPGAQYRQFKSYEVSYASPSSTYYSSSGPQRSLRLVTSDVLDLLEQYVTPSKRIGARVMAQWGSSYWTATIVDANDANYLANLDRQEPGPALRRRLALGRAFAVLPVVRCCRRRIGSVAVARQAARLEAAGAYRGPGGIRPAARAPKEWG
jgi:hypothetical protein